VCDATRARRNRRGILDLAVADCQRVVAEIEAAGGKALALQASIADRGQMTAAIGKLREALGPLTIVVNNAGMTGMVPFGTSPTSSGTGCWKSPERNFHRHAIGAADMVAAKWGRIVNISSSSAQTGAAGMVHYSASKGAMISMTRSLAQELGPLGITVNNIPPGTIMIQSCRKQTGPNSDVDGRSGKIHTGAPDGGAGRHSKRVCLACFGRFGYVTGQTIGVNGGRSRRKV